MSDLKCTRCGRIRPPRPAHSNIELCKDCRYVAAAAPPEADEPVTGWHAWPIADDSASLTDLTRDAEVRLRLMLASRQMRLARPPEWTLSKGGTVLLAKWSAWDVAEEDDGPVCSICGRAGVPGGADVCRVCLRRHSRRLRREATE